MNTVWIINNTEFIGINDSMIIYSAQNSLLYLIG